MKTKTIVSCIALAFLFIGLIFCSGKREEAGKNKEYIIGVKIYNYEGNLLKLFEEWRSLGINTALVSDSLLSNKEFRDLARTFDITTFVILPIFFNPLDK